MSAPHLPVVTKEQIDLVMAEIGKVNVHRMEPKACGWSGLLGAYTMGEIWFWFVDGTEVATIVPVEGYPYTRREEAFNAYLEAFEQH